MAECSEIAAGARFLLIRNNPIRCLSVKTGTASIAVIETVLRSAETSD